MKRGQRASRTRRRRGVSAAAVGSLLAICLPVSAHGQGSEFLVVFGAGRVGAWDTEFTISSSIHQVSTVIVSHAPTQPCPPDTSCHLIEPLVGDGTIVLPSPPGAGVGAVYVGTTDNTAVPRVAARAFVSGSACMTLDLPVFRVASLVSLNPAALVFPGARRGSAGRTNLLLANVADPNELNGSSVDLALEALDAGGVVIGQGSVSLSYANTVFVPDVLGSLGVTELENGQLRVTKVGGLGSFWGVMPIARADGSFAVILGTSP